MKYIKEFEGKTKKDILQKKINLYNEFIPGTYLIFSFSRYSWSLKKMTNYLIFSQIISIKNESSGEYFSTKLAVRMLDYEFDFEEINNKYIIDNILELYINDKNIKKLYNTTSLKDAEYKYNQIRYTEPYKTWKINRDSSKYNL